MYCQRLVQLLFVALSFMAVAQALNLDADLFHFANNGAVRRADESIAAESSDSPVSTANDSPASSAAPAPSAPASSAPAEVSSAAPVVVVSSSAAPPPPPTPSSSSNPAPISSSAPPAQTSAPVTSTIFSTKEETTTPPAQTTIVTTPHTEAHTNSPTDKVTKAPVSTTSTTQAVYTSTFLTTITKSDGSTTAVETETLTTPTGTLSSSQGGKKASGMSTQTRNIIIGVVVGVGGAIILAVIGLVAFRIRRRNQAARDGNGLNDYDPNFGNTPVGALEKNDSSAPNSAGGPGRSPFQSTLESYHTPTQVNTASNF
ncbi:MAG: hypothetical protein STHCBS139747_006946 [Sporothrix thermara]